MPISKASGQAVAPAAKGDLVVGSATNDAAVLGVGSADQVLTVDSSTTTGLKWATPSAGGMTLISTTSLSGASVALTSIPSTYNHLQLIIRGFRPSTDNSQLQMRLQNDTGARYRSVYGAATSTLGGGNLSFADTFWYMCDGNDNTVTNGFFIMDFFDYANTSTWKAMHFRWWLPNATTPTSMNYGIGWCAYNQTGAIDQINIFTSSGNIAGGTALLYGVK